MAEADLGWVCEQDDAHGSAFYYRGEALNRLGRFDEALQSLERATVLQPQNAKAFYTLGHLYDRKHMGEEAALMYRRGLGVVAGMIQVLLGGLYEQETEGILRPIRADLVPVTSASRDVAEGAGETMNDKLEQIGAIPLGGAVITPAGDLSADFVIHAVVSAPDEPETPASVQKALRNSLRRATDLGLESLALPPLGTGIGQLEAEETALAMLEMLFFHLDEGQPPFDVRIVTGSEYEQRVFERLVAEMTSQRTVLEG